LSSISLHSRVKGRLSKAAFLRDFSCDLPEAKAKLHYAVQQIIPASSPHR
jgi:hypothetical protein